jgi:membrane protease YdiL (CAAX protease family)
VEKELTFGVLLTNFLVLGIMFLGITNWGFAIRRVWRRQPLVEWEPRRNVPWGLFDLIIAIVLVLGGTIVAAKLMQTFGWLPYGLDLKNATPRQTALLIFADGGSRLVVMPLLLAMIALRTGATLKDFGFVPSKLWSDIRLGAGAFTMLLPLVFLIQAILTRFQKYEHELINVLGELPGWQWAVAMVFVAGVSAPIAEEILFRLLLQGWIEKIIAFHGPTHELVLGALRPRHRSATSMPSDSEQSASLLDHSGVDPSVPATEMVVDPNSEVVPPELRRFGWIAIAISSIVFALLHWSNGPAWVALTVLAAGMGYLYQRTHRIVPSLVVHAMLNNLTMLIVLFNPESK